MKESKMSMAVTPSLTRKLFNMALEIGDDVIDLTLGDPDVLPPKEVREAACEAIMSGKTRYSSNAGLFEVRKAYANFFESHYGLSVNPQENVITTVGGMEGLFLGLAATVDEGDEVIILGPYYVNYFQMIKMCGGRPIIINRIGKNDNVLLDEINCSITERTVAIILNSPCNPVGDILSNYLISEIAKIVSKHNFLVVTDEVYNSLVYEGKKADSILNYPGMLEKTLLIDSCSKRFAMTGWRVGFAVGPKDLIARMTKMQENVAACTPLPSQYAAIKAYSEDFDYSYIREEYEKRRNIVYNALCKIPGLKPIKPKATFYCFVDISETAMSGDTFAYELLEKKHVAVVPGNAYGDMYDHYIRIAFTLNVDKLNQAMKRINDFCNDIIS